MRIRFSTKVAGEDETWSVPGLEIHNNRSAILGVRWKTWCTQKMGSQNLHDKGSTVEHPGNLSWIDREEQAQLHSSEFNSAEPFPCQNPHLIHRGLSVRI